MRLIILSLVLLTAASKTWAHHYSEPYYYGPYGNPYSDSLEQHLSIAYGFPNQLEAAVQWRLNHPYADISLHLGSFHRRGWHPSIIALLHHPHFVVDIHFHPRWERHYWYKPHRSKYYHKHKRYYKNYYRGYHKNHHKRYYKNHNKKYKHWKKQKNKHYHRQDRQKKRVRVKER